VALRGVAGTAVAVLTSMVAKRKTSSAKRRSSSRRGSGKRDLVKAGNANFHAKRTSRGRFSEMDEQGRSLVADRRRKAKTTTKSGHGDRRDRAA
jgi:hypothetical protein